MMECQPLYNLIKFFMPIYSHITNKDMVGIASISLDQSKF